MIPKIFGKRKKVYLSPEEKIKLAVSSKEGSKSIKFNYVLYCVVSALTAITFILIAKAAAMYVELILFPRMLIDTFPTILQYTYLSIIFSITTAILMFIQHKIARDMAVREENWLRVKLIKHLFELGPTQAPDKASGATFSNIIDGSEKVSYYLQTFLGQVLASFTVPFITVAIIGIFIDPLSALILFICLPLIPLVVGLFQRAFHRVSSKSRNARIRLAGQYLEAIQGIVTLRLLNAHKRKEEELAHFGENNRKAIMDLLASNQLIIFVVDATFSLFAITVSATLASYRFSTGAITLADAVALIFVSIVFMEPLDQAAAFFYVGMGGMASKRKIQGIFSIKTPKQMRDEQLLEDTSTQEDTDTNENSADELSNADKDSVITVSNLQFKYENKIILDDVNLEVKSGDKVAVIGSSGNGKTTLINILKAYLLPIRGKVVIDNQELTEANQDLVTQKSAYVSQHTWLFNTSVKENMLIANPSATDDEIWQALQKAHIADEIRRLPDGLDTLVGEQGMSISGGQAQRLSIARAFLSGRNILIFDEPTSQIDLISEQKLLQSIREIDEDKTLIMVTHRLNNLGSLSKVVRIQDGHISQISQDDLDIVQSAGTAKTQEKN